MIIRDLTNDVHEAVRELILAGFSDTGSEEMATLLGAEQTIASIASPGCIARIAVEADEVIGLVGGLPGYHGHVFELHPLVVHPSWRRRGVGRALVADLERQAAQRGASTLWLGTDDEDERTSLGGIDLYPDVLAKLAAVRNLRNHPFEFYRRVGFVIVGTLPDANGPGKPDIFMAKRLKAITPVGG